MEEKMAYAFANKLRLHIEELKIKHNSSSAYKYISVSIGLYTVPHNVMSSPDKIYEYADNALYEAKSKGRNQVINYQDKQQQEFLLHVR